MTLRDNRPDRRVQFTIDTGLRRGFGTVQLITEGVTFTISDRDFSDNSCACLNTSRIRRVPADYPTIQQAIDAAVDGDTVLVAPGTYVENLNLFGKAITVTSEGGAELTTIDGRNNFASTVTMSENEGRQSVLNGFTIQKGIGANDFGIGGGIAIEFASPTITNNIVTDNRASFGGRIGVRGGGPLIQSNVVTNNAAGGGGGIGLSQASGASILDNTIWSNLSNEGGGIALQSISGGTTLIRGNKIVNNVVEGLVFGDGTPASQGGGILEQERLLREEV